MDYKDIKVSIIVPVYNLQYELERCVSSIQNQTHKNIEIILVNDGSSDKSWDIMQSLSQKDSRIYLINKKNGGVTTARLAGIEQASGEYIGFVDGDDEVEADMFSLLLKNAIEHQAEISHCGYQMIFEDGRVNYFYNTGCLIEQDRITGLKELLGGSRIEPGLCNKLFHRSLFRFSVIDKSIRINEDLLMNYYLFNKTNKSVFEDICKYHYLVRRSSASRQKLNEHRIYDPIQVKKIILEDCDDTLKDDAEKALLTTSVYCYCSLVIDGRTLKKAKKDVQTVIRSHYEYAKLLPKKTRFLAFLILKLPIIFSVIYTCYAKILQKKKYD